MPSKIFLSHDHRDRGLAKIIARTISRVTLRQLEVWFSSDASPAGGIQVGSVWLDRIRSELEESKAVLVLLTPSSLARPWLLFESGFGAANQDCEVIPVCVGINSLRDVPYPLAMYQCYQLVDYESLKNFMARILLRYEIVFDEELAEPLLSTTIEEIADEVSGRGDESAVREPTLSELSSEIRGHFDRRLMEFADRYVSASEPPKEHRREFTNIPYTVPIHLKIPERDSIQYLEIHDDTSVQDLLDNVYYMLRPKVKAFSYLETWLMREIKTGKNLVVREVSDWILARPVFRPESEWEAVGLEEPYRATDYSDHRRWYYKDIPALKV